MTTATDGQAASEAEEREETKTEAEARAARIDADRKQAELDEWVISRPRRDRDSEAATVKAETARRNMWAELVPDLSGVDLGETKTTEVQAIYGSSLGLLALRAAADKVGAAVAAKSVKSVLVTDDVDLAGADAAYRVVISSLDELLAVAGNLLAPPLAGNELAGIGMAVGSAVAKVIPAVLRLVSARRSLSTLATSGDDLAAATSVIGALLGQSPVAGGLKVWHGDFRLLSSEIEIEKELGELTSKRYELALKAEGLQAGAERETIKSFVTAVATFLTAVSTVPTGASVSALVNARLYEDLHTGEIEYVLLIKGLSGSTSQLLNDRPLWSADKFSVLATASISYLLLDKQSRQVVAGGTASGIAAVRGEIGEELRVGPAVQA